MRLLVPGVEVAVRRSGRRTCCFEGVLDGDKAYFASLRFFSQTEFKQVNWCGARHDLSS